MKSTEQTDNNNELKWMFTSIKNLMQAEDHLGALVFCLITIEALGKKRRPDNKFGNGDRFREFLYEEGEGINIRSGTITDAAKEMKDLERISKLDNFEQNRQMKEKFANMVEHERLIWKHVRNMMIHEGNNLSLNNDAVIALDWSTEAPSVRVRVRGKEGNYVFSGKHLLKRLCSVVEKYLGKNGKHLSPTQDLASRIWNEGNESKLVIIRNDFSGEQPKRTAPTPGGMMKKTLKRVKCPVCAARFKFSHVCRKLPNHPGITREWALNPPKRYRKS